MWGLLFDFSLVQSFSLGGWKRAGDDGGGGRTVSVLDAAEWYARKSTKMVNFTLCGFYHNSKQKMVKSDET